MTRRNLNTLTQKFALSAAAVLAPAVIGSGLAASFPYSIKAQAQLDVPAMATTALVGGKSVIAAKIPATVVDNAAGKSVAGLNWPEISPNDRGITSQ